MKLSSKILVMFTLVMMLCCVSAVSAADVNSTDDVIDEIAVDEVSDSVEDVEIDDASDDVVGEDDANKIVNPGNLRGLANINGNTNIGAYFDSNTGLLLSSAGNSLTFGGDFYRANFSFSNFKINRAVTINANTTDLPVLHDMGFELETADNIILEGITFIVNAPNGAECITINALDVNNSYITNNVITYTCNYDNSAYYNHVVRVVGGENVTVSGNTITAYLPLKNVDFSKPYPSIYTDLVAGVAVQSSNNFEFKDNKLYVNVSKTGSGYPTLDAFIIAGCNNATIAGNTIIEIDNKTRNSNNYLYAVDVYQCDNITIDNNIIRLESKGGSIIPGTNNGTSAAYGIQLTGGHTGVTISNNNIHTSNEGPNCGIYSQNFMGNTELNITGNTIYVEGSAGEHGWSLVTGMELQDDYVYVAKNNITVKNKATYVNNANAYGISYSQWSPNDHEQYIYCNNVTLINGKYAVYMLSSLPDSSEVAYNNLTTTYFTGDSAVRPNGDIYIHDNH